MTTIDIGCVRDVVRYPVKSMAGTPVDSAAVGWHGLAGDRRLAFRRIGDANGFPWLSASRLPDMLLHQPVGVGEHGGEPLPTHVRTPDGVELDVGSEKLNAYVSEHLGSPVEMMKLKHGIFDEAAVSVIGVATVAGIAREVGSELDRRRFRANVVVETGSDQLFQEDEWVGGTLLFGDDVTGPAVNVTQRDLRCAMINLDPDTAERDPRVLKAVARLNESHAGVYAAVVRTGTVRVGDTVRLAK